MRHIIQLDRARITSARLEPLRMLMTFTVSKVEKTKKKDEDEETAAAFAAILAVLNAYARPLLYLAFLPATCCVMVLPPCA